MQKVNELIPCNTNHVAVFNDGSYKEIIGWASKNDIERKNGDVKEVSQISGLIVEDDEIVFADEREKFKEYKSETDHCKESVY